MKKITASGYAKRVLPMLLDLCLANKKTLTISAGPQCDMYTDQRFFLVQQLSLQHLNVNVRHNNNALKELNDCIEI